MHAFTHERCGRLTVVSIGKKERPGEEGEAFISSAREEQKTGHLEPRRYTISFRVVRAGRLDWGGDDFVREGG